MLAQEITPWQFLENELLAWKNAGRTPEFWLRDDDCVAATPRLNWLIQAANDFNVPLVLAVIPKNLEPSLAERIKNEPLVTVFQHGYRHFNHGQGTGFTGEFSQVRSHETMLAEINDGREILERAFGQQFMPVFVPPWNKIDPTLIPRLGEVGMMGASMYNPRPSKTINGVKIVNTHCDVVKWKPSAHFRGEKKNLVDFGEHLYFKREEKFDPTEPTGYLTHHLDHDAATDEFTRAFFQFTLGCGAKWLSPQEMYSRI